MLRAIAVLFFIFSFQAEARELAVMGQSVRQLGMGGVYIFDGEDAGSFLQNPAYTCFTKGLNITLAEFAVGVTGGKVAQDLQSLGSIDDPSDLDPLYGKNVWLGGGGHSTVMLPCFAVSLWTQAYTSFLLQNPAFPNMDMTLISDWGMQLGGGIPITKDIALGLSAKRVTRKGGTKNIGPDVLNNPSTDAILAEFQNTGVGYGLDVGLVGRFEEVALNPTVSLMWRDIGDTAFTKSASSAEAPDHQEDNLTLGMTVDGSGYGFGWSAGLEYRHINTVGEELGKKIHFGTEFMLGPIDLRGGWYQGYPTYGVGMNIWLFTLDAAMYSIEKGAYPGQTRDERMQVSLTFDLSFDANFNLTDTKNKRRSLKQRR